MTAAVAVAVIGVVVVVVVDRVVVVVVIVVGSMGVDEVIVNRLHCYPVE